MDYSEKGIARRIRRHIGAGTHSFFAVTLPGFESTSVSELEEIGIECPRPEPPGGITFEGTINDCFRVNLLSGTITRILMRVGVFKALHFDMLRKKAGALPWELYLGNSAPLAFSVACRRSRLRHTERIADELFEAIRSRMGMYGRQSLRAEGRESMPPAQRIYARFTDDVCTISIDTSGEPLYRRGYKEYVSDAPLRETIASLILRESDARSFRTIIDPMSGSGTFSIEAAILVTGAPPGAGRNFIFQTWPGFRPRAFAHLRERLLSDAKRPGEPGVTILCADKSPECVRVAQANMERSGFAGYIVPETRDFFSMPPFPLPDGRSLIVINPPFGKRIACGRESLKLYRQIGDTMRSVYRGCHYAIIVPGREHEKALNLPAHKIIPFNFGGINVTLTIGCVR